MGYRSDVVLAMKNEALKRFINESDVNHSVELLSCYDNKAEKEGWTLFHWNCVKWYEDYQDIANIMSFLATLNEEDSIDYEFHRSGEDGSDYEYRNSGESPFNINLVRHLDYSY